MVVPAMVVPAAVGPAMVGPGVDMCVPSLVFVVELETIAASELLENLSMCVLKAMHSFGSLLYDFEKSIPVPVQLASLACFLPGIVHPDFTPNFESRGVVLGIMLYLLFLLDLLDSCWQVLQEV